MDNTDILMKALMAIPEIPFNVRGVKKHSKCPFCPDGTLTAVRTLYNGHLHVNCDKCKFRLME